jgi:hypothetical protein
VAERRTDTAASGSERAAELPALLEFMLPDGCRPEPIVKLRRNLSEDGPGL